MKSTHLLLAGALLLSQSAIAQSSKTLNFLPLKAPAHAGTGKAAKTTSTGSRVTGELIAFNDGSSYVPADSAKINYSGTRGGDLYHPPLKYDNGTQYSYDASTSVWTNQYYLVQTFDANNNLLTSTQQNWDGPSSSWINNAKSINTFDANNDTLTNTSQTWNTTTSAWDNQSNNIYTWDANGNMLTDIYQNWTGSAWVNSNKYIYTYDASNNRLTEIDQSWNTTTSTWDNSDQYLYTYTTANKIATQIYQSWSAAWNNQSRVTYTYNSSNDLLTTLTQAWDAGTSTWDNNDLETATFDGTHDQLTDLQQYWDAGTTSWVNSYMVTNTGFSGTYPLQSIRQNWSGTAFVNTTMETYTYNSHSQPTTAVGTTWNTGGFWQPVSGDQSTRIDYEDYTTSVKNVNNTNCTASVYPVPAKDMLHVSITWNEPQAFTIDIMDMSGRTVSQWNMPTAKTYDGNITISSLPAGNYIMKMTGTNAQSVQQIIIAK